MIPYRTRMLLRKLGIAALVLSVVTALVLLCWFLWLQRFVVYTRNEGSVLDFSVSETLPVGETAREPDADMEIQIHYNEGDDKVNLSTDLTQLNGYYVRGSEVAENPAGVWAQIQALPAGTPVSYGCTYTAAKDSVIATVMAGYADGVPRALSGCGEVIIRGRKAPIVGRVCMDQFMVDVTHISGVQPGDVVTIFGADGDAVITADEVAEKAQTIHYELICAIASRVPRVYLKNGEVDSVTRTLPGE